MNKSEIDTIAAKMATTTHSNKWVQLMLMRLRSQPIAKLLLSDGSSNLAYSQIELREHPASSVVSIELITSKSDAIPLVSSNDLDKLMASQERERLIPLMGGFLLSDPETGSSFSVS